MKRMRQITLELVRHGPAHNQLLSPLTPYLALCGGHPAQTVRVKYEHQEALTHLRALRYRLMSSDADHAAAERQQREAHLALMARDLGELLNEVHGLTAEFGQHDGGKEAVHLRLVHSANELSLLPFELAMSSVAPGVNLPLLLRAPFPLCLTRESRSAVGRHVSWPRKPRVLFIASDAGGHVPLEEHLDVLGHAIAPWVRATRSHPFAQSVTEHLRVLPNASLPEIERICRQAEPAFTHVHILAHGGAYDLLGHEHFGLVLYEDRRGNRSIVATPQQLACALLGQNGEGGRGLHRPAVLSLATCDSANTGSVITNGSSLAHYLHAQGVPLVIGSQFPLTKRASITMASVLYERLLWGDDPRRVLHDLRTQLGTMNQYGHDWASLVAYASLPDDLEAQLEEIRVEYASQARWVAADNCADVLEPLWQKGMLPSDSNAADKERMGRALAQLNTAVARSYPDLPAEDDETVRQALKDRVRKLGHLASSEKRRAQIFFQLSHLPDNKEYVESDPENSRQALARACHLYRRASELDPDNAWVGTQHLALRLAQRLTIAREDWSHLVRAASCQAQALHASRPLDAAWQHMNLLELAVLAAALPQDPPGAPGMQAPAIGEHLEAVGRLDPADASMLLASTYFQLRRYVDWWPVAEEVRDRAWEALQQLCRRFGRPLKEALRADRQRDLIDSIAGAVDLSGVTKAATLKVELLSGLGKVEDARPGSAPFDPRDPLQNRFGGRSEDRAHRVSAFFEEKERGRICTVTLRVEAISGEPLQESVCFHLHPTFPNREVCVAPRDGVAELVVLAWGAFTVGVTIEGKGTRLELNLADERWGAPAWFRSR